MVDEQERERNVTDEDKIQRYVPGEKLPDLWIIFDTRGELVGQIANKSVTLATDSEHYPNTKKIAAGLGKFHEVDWLTAIAAPVNTQQAVQRFKDEGYVIDKADEQDFRELQNELDKLLTIDDDTMNPINAKRTASDREDG